jgi:hypothetical protein
MFDLAQFINRCQRTLETRMLRLKRMGSCRKRQPVRPPLKEPFQFPDLLNYEQQMMMRTAADAS